MYLKKNYYRVQWKSWNIYSFSVVNIPLSLFLAMSGLIELDYVYDPFRNGLYCLRKKEFRLKHRNKATVCAMSSNVMSLSVVILLNHHIITIYYFSECIHCASEETYHFFRTTLTKIQSIKMNYTWAQISYTIPYQAHLKKINVCLSEQGVKCSEIARGNFFCSKIRQKLLASWARR